MERIILQKNHIKFTTIVTLEEAFKSAAYEKNQVLMRNIHDTQMFVLGVISEIEEEAVDDAVNVLVQHLINLCNEDNEGLIQEVADMHRLAKVIEYLKNLNLKRCYC